MIKNQTVIVEQAKKYDSFYWYDEANMIESAKTLNSDFEDVTFLYSIKANPNPHILDTIFAQGIGADVASAAEVAMAYSRGVKKCNIQYSAPGKTRYDIESTLDKAVIIADSFHEIELIEEIAKQRHEIVEIGVRLNPDFGFLGGDGLPSKFGIDESLVLEQSHFFKSLKQVKVVGIHVHLRSQELDANVLKQYYANILSMVSRVEKALAITLEFINFGSGIGIPYGLEDPKLDTKTLGIAMKELLPKAKVYIETGRYLVGNHGVYVTKVVDKKVSKGQTFVILNNTLNGFIRPSMAQLVESYANKDAVASEPLYTGKDCFAFIPLTEETDTEVVTLVGNLCTATDVIAKNIQMKKLQIGDLVVMTNAGSYARVLTPVQFATLRPPVELYYTKDGQILETN